MWCSAVFRNAEVWLRQSCGFRRSESPTSDLIFSPSAAGLERTPGSVTPLHGGLPTNWLGASLRKQPCVDRPMRDAFAGGEGVPLLCIILGSSPAREYPTSLSVPLTLDYRTAIGQMTEMEQALPHGR
jgi:hypothetical protein